MVDLTLMMKRLLFALLLAVGTMAQGQDITNLLELGDRAYEDGRYYTAIKYYEKVLGQDDLENVLQYPYGEYGLATDSIDLVQYLVEMERLADSYRMIFDYKNAEKWYRAYFAINDTKDPEAQYEYGVVLRANEKYNAALVELNEAVEQQIPGDLSEKIRFEIQCAEFGKRAKDYPEYHEISKKDVNIFNPANSGDYAPSPLNNKDFIFTTTRETRPQKRRRDPVRYYHSLKAYKNGVLFDYTFEGLDPDKEYEMAAPSITEDHRQMYFNMWNPDLDIPGPNGVGLYVATRITDASWAKPILLDSIIGADEGVTNKYPFVTPDGTKLYFCSERKDGLGGLDIYEITLNAAGLPVGEPRNLGAAVNSAGNDISPFWDEENGKFYFASDGRVGLGGYDLFVTETYGGAFGEVENLGFPINSSADDAFLIILENTTGILASDRDKGCCYELFDFTLRYKSAVGYVFNKSSQTPIEGVKITLRDTTTGKIIETARSDEDGRYVVSIVEDKNYFVLAEDPLYLDGEAYFSTYGIPGADSAFIGNIFMIPTDTGQIVTLDNIYYDFGKATLRPESYPTLDFLAQQLLKRPLLKARVGSHTDAIGSERANLALSNRRSQSVVDYLIERGVPEAQIVAVGYGESRPIAPNENPDGSDNPEGRQLNRRTTFEFIKPD